MPSAECYPPPPENPPEPAENSPLPPPTAPTSAVHRSPPLTAPKPFSEVYRMSPSPCLPSTGDWYSHSKSAASRKTFNFSLKKNGRSHPLRRERPFPQSRPVTVGLKILDHYSAWIATPSCLTAYPSLVSQMSAICKTSVTTCRNSHPRRSSKLMSGPAPPAVHRVQLDRFSPSSSPSHSFLP